MRGSHELNEQGDCIACGRHSTCKPKNRQLAPLTGSGGLRNFLSTLPRAWIIAIPAPSPSNARNVLFHIDQELTRRYVERWGEENAAIRLYHFTNYIQGPELDIHDLPAPVFRFLAQARLHE